MDVKSARNNTIARRVTGLLQTQIWTKTKKFGRNYFLAETKTIWNQNNLVLPKQIGANFFLYEASYLMVELG